MNQGSGTPALQPSKALARERMRRLQECDKLALLMGSGLAKYAIEIGPHGRELQAGINRGPLQVESFGQRSREPHFTRATPAIANCGQVKSRSSAHGSGIGVSIDSMRARWDCRAAPM